MTIILNTMAKKTSPSKPAEAPIPGRVPEVGEPAVPELPALPGEDPDIIPEEDPFENPPPYEIPPPGEAP